MTMVKEMPKLSDRETVTEIEREKRAKEQQQQA